MDTTIELDDFRSAWAALHAWLSRSNALNLQLVRGQKVVGARRSLRPLLWGQIAQMLFGLGLASIAVAFWTQHRESPVLLTMGIVLHAYGVVTMIAGGITLSAMSRIDYAAPVLAIQMRLMQVRRTYVTSGMVAGLGWWLLWMPFTTVLFGLMGADQQHVTWAFYLPGTLVGVAGLAATWAFDRWSRAPGRERLRRSMESGLIGAALSKAKAQMDEIERFERE